MFRLPAYDQVGIAVLGFGILAVAACRQQHLTRFCAHDPALALFTKVAALTTVQ